MSISSFVPSSCFHGYLSLCSVHYLSLPPFPSLSLSLCSYLSHFAFISASLPPALSHTLLTPAFISLHFHLSFTFLSPSSLPFHHAGFWFLLIERKFYRFPCQFCIFNHFQFIQPTFNAIESCIKLSWAECVSVCDSEMETIGAGGCSLFTIIKKEE